MSDGSFYNFTDDEESNMRTLSLRAEYPSSAKAQQRGRNASKTRGNDSMTRKQAELYCEINKLRIRMQPHKTADGRKCWMLDLIPLWKHTGAPVSVTAATMGEALIDAVQRHRDIRRGKA